MLHQHQMYLHRLLALALVIERPGVVLQGQQRALQLAAEITGWPIFLRLRHQLRNPRVGSQPLRFRNLGRLGAQYLRNTSVLRAGLADYRRLGVKYPPSSARRCSAVAFAQRFFAWMRFAVLMTSASSIAGA